MSEIKNKTLSVVVTHDSVFFIDSDPKLTFSNSGQKEILDFISNLHAGDYIDYNIKVVNAGNKFIISDNDRHLQSEDFLTGCTKFTGQNIYVKFIQHFSELNTSNHISALIDHYYYLKEKDVIHLHFEKGNMYIYIKQNGLFILYNNYEIGIESDVLYFCNLAFDTINEPVKEGNKWVLSGKIDVESEIYKSLLRYFPEFTFVDVPFYSKDQNSGEKGHYHFFHYLNLTCAS